jgi:hypothetical protein
MRPKKPLAGSYGAHHGKIGDGSILSRNRAVFDRISLFTYIATAACDVVAISCSWVVVKQILSSPTDKLSDVLKILECDTIPIILLPLFNLHT